MTVLQKIIEHFKSQSHADDDYYRPMAVADVLKRYLEAEEQQIRDTWKAADNFADEQQRYPYGKRDGIYEFPNLDQHIKSLNS